MRRPAPVLIEVSLEQLVCIRIDVKPGNRRKMDSAHPVQPKTGAALDKIFYFPSRDFVRFASIGLKLTSVSRHRLILGKWLEFA